MTLLALPHLSLPGMAIQAASQAQTTIPDTTSPQGTKCHDRYEQISSEVAFALPEHPSPSQPQNLLVSPQDQLENSKSEVEAFDMSEFVTSPGIVVSQGEQCPEQDLLQMVGEASSDSVLNTSPTPNTQVTTDLSSSIPPPVDVVTDQVEQIRNDDTRGAPGSRPSAQGASVGSAATASPCSTTGIPIVARSGSTTSPETDSPAYKGRDIDSGDGHKNGPTGIFNAAANRRVKRSPASPAVACDIPRAGGSSSKRSRGARSFVITARPSTRRGRCHIRFPKAPAGNRAPLKTPSGEASNQALQVDERTEAHQDPTAQDGPDNPETQGVAAAQDGPAAQQKSGATSQIMVPSVDMKGIPHVLGGLVEESVGCRGSLFARQVQGHPSVPYHTRVERHDFWSFPPPDMGEYNREFAKELEESRPLVDGFQPDAVDTCVERYTERSELFADAMKEQEAALDVIWEQLVALKAMLTDLNDTRESSITDEYARKPKLTPEERLRVLAKVTEAEEPLLKEMEVVKHDLKEQVLCLRGKVARALRYDFNAARAIDDSRVRAERRSAVEKQITELWSTGTWLGLPGGLRGQDNPVRRIIAQNTQLVVDELMKEFDEPSGPDQMVFEGLASDTELVVTTVPDWFYILDAKGTVALHGATSLARYRDLMQLVGNSYVWGWEEEMALASRPAKKPFTMQFHEPGPDWPQFKQRLCGGWWTCRSGPDATPAEIRCGLCHPTDPAEVAEALERTSAASRPSYMDRHKYILDEIEKATTEAHKRDRLMLKHQLQQEQADISSSWEQRELRRSGGGFELDELLCGGTVNQLNHQPKAGRSQSWNCGDPSQTRSLLQHEPVEAANRPSRIEPPEPWPLVGSPFQPQELLIGKRASKPSSFIQTSLPPILQHYADSPGSLRQLNGMHQVHELLLGRQASVTPSQRATPSWRSDRHGSSANSEPSQDGPVIDDIDSLLAQPSCSGTGQPQGHQNLQAACPRPLRPVLRRTTGRPEFRMKGKAVTFTD